MERIEQTSSVRGIVLCAERDTKRTQSSGMLRETAEASWLQRLRPG
jgi:hypothetical protein